MKRIFFPVFLVMLFSASLVLAGDSFEEGDELRISVSQTKLKSSPQPFGAKVLKTLELGAVVTYLSSEGAFYKVESDGTEGYIPTNSLVESKQFKSFSRTASVTETDMAAATKGFSPEVEEQNRSNTNLRYEIMDEAEKKSTVKDPEGDLAAFRKEGLLGEYTK